MKLIFEIEYRTRWGERLVLLLGKRKILLEYVDNGLWRGAFVHRGGADALEYRYAVECDGACIRREWGRHVLPLSARSRFPVLRIRDRWIDIPADAPFHSAAFTRGFFSRSGGAAAAKRTSTAGEAVLLRLVVPSLWSDEVLAIASDSLDAWQRILPLDDSRFPEWSLAVHLPRGSEYKFLIADRKTLEPILWEEGANRTWNRSAAVGEQFVEASLLPRFPERRWRGAGTAIPVFSLRSRESFGVGEFPDLKLLIDWAAATRQRVIQLLPVHDTTMSGTWEDSYPYNANSSFALHPQFLRLTAAGVPEDEEYCRLRDELNALAEVDYERVNRTKQRLLREAFARQGRRTASRSDYRAFVEANRSWLIPYAAYCTLRDEYGTAEFSQWGDYARYDEKRIAAYCLRNRREVAFHCYVQYHLHLQLSEVVRYAHARGVILKGDLPIGVSRTSADAWQSPRLFHLDAQAGAPPDAFSAAGQNWGFPTYDWERMARDGYAWWRSRLRKMSEYFDAYRIDHILGFFRIWEIPAESVHGLLGHFNPALPYSAEELRERGFDLSDGRHTTPPTEDWVLERLFGDRAGEVRSLCIRQGRLIPACATQRRVLQRFSGADESTTRLREGLLALLDDVLFVEDPRRKGFYHPRIDARTTCSYQLLAPWQREAFDRLHDDFFYRRHDRFWRESGLRKLPMLLTASDMLPCGEDLGMIPDCVPETMRMLQILSLEVQRMPKEPGETFADPARYPYLSVCTTSTHDMNPLRAWWEEDRALTARFYREVLHGEGNPPWFCEPWVCRRIVEMHLASPAMLAVLPLQDWLSMDGTLRLEKPDRERINIPAVPRHYWRYRMHLTLEELLAAEEFNTMLHDMIAMSRRR
ncbi:4-alpha-glucanotransferase [Alistipes sp.]|uniref:4-alpha-glucanotransferase n=1 Tax=Alistipes sp. TaxID=1872444 RepID=UPI0025C40C56|nr:4-alpha-glucanotransferase [Alistipes sp.]MCI7140230.1 4-alpha-glucanotransferase [Alistipes sp.]MDY5396359.1 4-alpha-glucanotransferase [Alistipes sp.]